MNKKMHDLIDAGFDELVTAVQKFVKMDSVAEDDKIDMKATHPFGEKMTGVLNEFLSYASAKGFAVKNVANAAGYAECGAGKDLIGVLCHLDVVPTGSREQWKNDPFSGVVENGKLFGRGSIDDKGPAIAALYALKALKESGMPLNYRYRLIVGLDEESGLSRCLGKYLEKEETPAYSFSPDAFFPIINAEKGILRLDINGSYSQQSSDITIEKITAGDRYNVVPDLATAYFTGAKAKALLQPLTDADCTLKEEGGKVVFSVKGVSAHAMEPHKGKNALQILMKKLITLNGLPKEIVAVQKIVGTEITGAQFNIAGSDEVSGPLTCNAAALKWENGKYTLKFDMRYPVTANSDKIVENIKKAAEAQGAVAVIQQNKLPLHLPAEMPFIQILLGAYNDLTGEKGKPFSVGGGTYCRFLKNSVSFGPIFPHEEEMAHKPNEFAALDSLRKATHIYAEALYRVNEMK